MSDGPKYPDFSVPAIFSDGVESMTHSSENVKFYLGRFDSDARAIAPSQVTTVAQVIMPITAFISTAFFMDERLERLIADGFVTKEEVDENRAKYRAMAQNAERSN